MDFSEADSVAAVVASLADTPDPRTKQVVTSLVEHLHAFLRDVRPTLAEWEQGIDFLTAVGQQCDAHRQEFILLSDVLGASMLVETMEAARQADDATASTVLGPFHVVTSPERALGDEVSPDSDGDRCLVEGTITDPDGTPVPGARVDVWQANAHGAYDVQADAEHGGDQHLGNGRGLFTADDRGRYRFTSIVPAHYPIPTDGPVGDLLHATARHPFRPAHIHLQVTADGHVPLTTHVFVADSPYIDGDAVFAVKQSLVREFAEVSDPERAAALGLPDPFRHARFDIVLQPVPGKPGDGVGPPR